ncbi:helix-turn-helix domain-containing protein [Flavobacterium sp.]|uniref:helix-turn-helix domain-containing protein n=1 Tax=Flavobacterium sp. TaxID=239 RepID=UPI0037518CD3
MYTSDKNIIDLIDLLKYKKQIIYVKDFCKEIGLQEQNISKIKQSTAHFTVSHIEMICKKYNVNANWIFGVQKNIFNLPEPKQIKELP